MSPSRRPLRHTSDERHQRKVTRRIPMQPRNAQRARATIAAAVSALFGDLAFAAPAAAQGVIASGAGRAGATVAGLVALIGVITGGLALVRSRGGIGTGKGR